MKFYGDYHTHSVYSHGRGTIAENAGAAAKKGLKQVAITDHGFRHMLYNVKRRSVPSMQKEVAEASALYNIEVLLGLETNITGPGEIDVRPADYEFLDIVLCGYHRFIMSLRPRDLLHFSRVLFFNPKKLTERNTDLYRSVIEKYPIDVISHPGLNMRVDVEKVAEACAAAGTMIELNGKGAAFSDDEFRAMAATGVEFIVNSDAHRPEKVGDFTEPLELLKRVPVPESQIANLNKKPVFRSQKNR